MKKLITTFVFLLLIVPSFGYVYAQGADGGGAGADGGGIPAKTTIDNPVGVTSIAALADKIFSFIIDLSYIVIAFFFLLSGFKFITAQGSDTELTKAKTMFWYTVVGALLIIGAKTIIAIFQSIIKGLN